MGDGRGVSSRGGICQGQDKPKTPRRAHTKTVQVGGYEAARKVRLRLQRLYGALQTRRRPVASEDGKRKEEGTNKAWEAGRSGEPKARRTHTEAQTEEEKHWGALGKNTQERDKTPGEPE